MAISPSGEIFIADWPRGRILRIDLEGNVSTVSSGFVLDAFNIAFDNRGNLYQNQGYLTQVSLDDGNLSSPFLKEFNVVLNSRPFDFDSSGDVILVGPTTNNLFRASIQEGRISVLVGGPGNSYGLAVGPSGDLYLGASNEFPVEDGSVLRISSDGEMSEYVTGFTTIKDILFDEEGNMYVSDVDYGGEGGGRIVKITPEGTATVLFSGFYDLNNMVLDAANGNFLAFDNNSRQILSISSNGEVTPIQYDFGSEIHTVELTPDLEDGLIALVVFMEGHDTGPVHRGLFRISSDDQVTHLTDIDTPLATTEDDVFMHPSGDIFVVGPEEHPVFRMLKITPQGEVSVFARNLPYDTLSLTINDTGDIFFTCSAGLFKISEVE
jgi:sugar lactone lactonase YvrE